ncbi:MAG: CDP-alcohol phosphatidyltransferase family protein [Firmicutes bacterium]|nr:CDP-alcohol phosphatidyltransferase family protein [Bacillota bacterium]
MIGFYDYTVILTFCSLISSVIGATYAMQRHFRTAVFLLAIAGLFDAFDGKVARSKKNRTSDEKLYGIQLDSLVDVISFGIFPILICYLIGMQQFYDIIILCFYGICGVIRLAYFNVLESNNHFHPTNEEKVYHGLPITSIAVILPLTILTSFVLSQGIFLWILRILMLAIGFLFIIDFKLKKPTNTQLGILVSIVAIIACCILLFSKYHLPPQAEPESPLAEMELD